MARCFPKWLVAAALLAGCGTTVRQPYESCTSDEGCSQGTACLPTSLPVFAGFTGAVCTNACAVSTDCLPVFNNFDTSCVNGQCYLTCPSGNISCPYGTTCLSFTDQNGFLVNLCTP
jgi:hypothetical protein